MEGTLKDRNNTGMLSCLIPSPLPQMQAPWKALYSNHYDDKLKLTVPLEVSNPPPGKGSASGSNEEVCLHVRPSLRSIRTCR